MARPVHAAEALSRFQNGEARLVYARRRERPDEPPYYLEDGTARQVREWAKEYLECFMPECTDRRLTTVARASKRDGFTHHGGAGGHKPEGLFHQQAKALIARWVGQRWPGIQVALEQASSDGSRRADVMLTWPDARQVAVEVQYAPLSVHTWQQRHHSYTEQGITPVWLFGHLRPHLREARGILAMSDRADRVIDLGEVQQAATAEGATVLWINPVEELLATAWVTDRAHTCLTRDCQVDDDREYPGPPTAGSTWGFFAADALSDCTLTPDGISTPTSRRLAQSQAALVAAQEADRRRQAPAVAAQQRRDEALDRRKAEEAARRAVAQAADERLRAWMKAQRPQHTRTWLASGLRAKVQSRYGAVPPLLAADLPHAHGVTAHPEHWHAALYGDLILGQDEGARFTVADCYRALNRHGIASGHGDGSARARAVTTYVDYLAEHGLLHKHLVRGSTWRIDHYEVIGDIDTAPRRQAEREAAHWLRIDRRRQEKQEKARAAKQRRETRQRHEAERIESAPSQAPESPFAPPPAAAAPTAPRSTDSAERDYGPRYTHCRVCRQPLADVLAGVGKHVMC